MEDLLRNIRTRQIIEKYNFKFNKSLGQNFLIDDNILKKIIHAAQLTKNDCVLEVGPGVGTLTIELAEHAKKVLTIEIDKNLIPILKETLKGYDNVILHHGDALKENLKEIVNQYLEQPICICANIPYYITTPLITKFFEAGVKITNIVIMVQKEVAERIVAKPGSKEYGALSLLVQYYSKPHIVAVVPPSCFTPRPKVDSVVIKLEANEQPPADIHDKELFFKIIKSSFSQRRKTLSNSLKSLGISKEELNTAFEKSNIDPKRRGETLTLEEFAVLSNEILKII